MTDTTPANVLPSAARDILVNASRVADPSARLIAIDEAIDYVKLRFPKFFHPTPLFKD